MSIKRISLLLVIILSIAATVIWISGNPYTEPVPTPSSPDGAESTPAPEASSTVPKPAAPPVDLQARTQALQNPPMLTPEEIEDDAEMEKEQIDAALAQLRDPDVAQRIEGAEQLGAYPTKEAETALVQALGADPEAEVRSAAAQSLGYVEKPAETTLNALFSALEDQDEEVRGSALSTLEDFLLGSDEGSRRYKQILAGFKARGDSRSVPQDTREAIHDILQDVAGTTP